MNYSRPKLIYNWHKYREAEPKDYDISACPEGQKKLHKSTYKHFGTYINTEWTTTAEAQMSQYHLKKDYETREVPKSMVQASSFHTLESDRETGCKSVLPRHPPHYYEMDLCTTYALDYPPPHVITKEAVSVTGQTVDFRRRLSYFTDVADHRRWGQNTWQDMDGPQPRV
ncbi:protein CFAP95 [Astyanax mexicanus]|uniref:Cilia and flagella associated protein 95 n=2 Tax=Astyanax mexicanus TaxID=7994 RepID=A0A3B1JNL8_ASTMX|nr:protein CFAP95 [Astyanax mexicanus]KAG9261845.1 hypothetical protein AMEX_G25450 [Astyanax mexicanus]